MFDFIRVPTSDFDDYYQRVNFALAWRMFVIFGIVIGVISSISFVSNDLFLPYYLSVFCLVVVGLIYMTLTRRYRLMLVLFYSGATCIIAGSVFGVRNVTHIIEILWMTIISLSAFVLLSKLWGFVFLSCTTVIFVTYFQTYFKDNLLNINLKTDMQWTIMSVEFVFAMFLIAFVILQFFKLNAYAILKRREAFDALNKEKRLVERQNQEKTVLLQEIHHRVKNNLQVIISLLRIHSQELHSEEAKQSFNEAISRIMTMSLIHQKMYERELLSHIHLEDYLKTLLDDILSSSVTKGAVKLNMSVDVLEIGNKTVVPLALIMNELVTNSIKHGVQAGGNIDINFTQSESNTFHMEYGDSGTWKKPSGTSLGIQLIDIFTEQLDGSYRRVMNEDGTTYFFTFTDLDSTFENSSQQNHTLNVI